jgi:hypothetical protein
MSIHRFVAAGAVVAAAIGVPGFALAHGSAGPGSKSTAAPSASALASKAAALPGLRALAASAGITENQLLSGLLAAKEAGGETASGVAGFARATGLSPATAQRIVHSIFGPQAAGPSLTGPSAVAALAARLGVSSAVARTALEQIGALARAHGVDPTSAAFAAIAHHMGVTPSQLAAALPYVKQALRATAG